MSTSGPGYRFEDIRSRGWHGNCQICGFDHDRPTALLIEWWSHTPDLPAAFYLCTVHAEELARFCVGVDAPLLRILHK